MAEDNVIEKLTVELIADYDKLLSGTKEGVDKSEKELDKLSKAPEKALGGFKQLGSYLSSQFLGIVISIGVAIAGAFAAQNIINFFGGLVKGAVDASAQMEKFTTQFTTLLGSAEKAQGRMKELAEFGIQTPVELPELVESSRLLQVFGGDVLATGKNLKMIGDIASGVGQPFQQIAFWVGRAYDAMKSGRPWGEAAMRLQEMGALSGKARSELEAMTKAGASGEEVWQRFSELVGNKFAGSMERLSKTFEGVMSNLADFQGMLLREGGTEFFEGTRKDAVELFDIISEPDNKDALIDLAKSAGALADTFREAITSPLLEGLKEVDPKEVEQLADSLDDFSKAVGRLISSDSKADINSTVTALTALVDVTTILTEKLATAKEFFAAGGKVVTQIIAPVTNLAYGFNTLNDALERFTGYDISDATRGLVDLTQKAEETEAPVLLLGDSIRHLKEVADDTDLSNVGDQAVEMADKVDGAATSIEEATNRIDGAFKGFADAQEKKTEATAKLEEDHAEKITEIDQDLADRQKEITEERNEAIAKLEKDLAKQRQEINEQTAEELAELEKETTKRREEINEQAAEQLAKLEEDTQDAISKVREDGQKQERREAQDHQREMRRLNDDYLFDLEDAVKNRDARAIVDLRRKHQKETREREQDFRLQQRREKEDLQGRVEEIRENERERRQEIRKSQQEQLADLAESEAERRAEIQEAQAKRLADLAESEAEKRAEIQASYEEEMAKAAENHAEQLASENERYNERKAALDEALQKRLEDTAKELADEEKINEEHAEKLLEILNKTFGAGGDIDALMEEFQNRRRQKMQIIVEFEQSIGASPIPTRRTGGSPSSPSSSSRQSQSYNRPLKTFAEGGSMVAYGPELALFGEKEPEMASFIPLSKLNQLQQNPGEREMTLKLEVSGSAPPGIKGAEIDQIAGVLVKALNQAGVRARR